MNRLPQINCFGVCNAVPPSALTHFCLISHGVLYCRNHIMCFCVYWWCDINMLIHNTEWQSLKVSCFGLLRDDILQLSSQQIFFSLTHWVSAGIDFTPVDIVSDVLVHCCHKCSHNKIHVYKCIKMYLMKHDLKIFHWALMGFVCLLCWPLLPLVAAEYFCLRNGYLHVGKWWWWGR